MRNEQSVNLSCALRTAAALASVLLVAGVQALAASPDVTPGPGEVQVVGTIKSVDAARNSFLMNTVEVVQPGGNGINILPPRPKTVTLDPATILHVRNGAATVRLNDLHQGINVVATGRDLGVGKDLPARDVQVWDRMTNGVYTLNGGGASPEESQAADGAIGVNPQGRVGVGGPLPTYAPAAPLDKPDISLPVPGEQVWSLAYSPDARYLASGGSGYGPIRTLTAASPAAAGTFIVTPGADTAAVGAPPKAPVHLQLWDGQTGKPLRTLPCDTAVFALAFSPTGRMLAAANADGTVGIWNLDNGQLAMTLGTPGKIPAIAVAYSPDGNLIASSNRSRVIQLWDAHTGAEGRQLQSDARVTGAIEFSPDGKTLVGCCADHTVGAWDVAAGQSKGPLNHEPVDAIKLAFSPDGKQLATGCANGEVDLWNVATGSKDSAFTDSHSRVTSIAFAPDGKKIAAGCQDHRIRIWEAATGKLIRTIQAHHTTVNSVAFNPGSDALASSGSDGTIRIWSIA